MRNFPMNEPLCSSVGFLVSWAAIIFMKGRDVAFRSSSYYILNEHTFEMKNNARTTSSLNHSLDSSVPWSVVRSITPAAWIASAGLFILATIMPMGYYAITVFILNRIFPDKRK